MGFTPRPPGPDGRPREPALIWEDHTAKCVVFEMAVRGSVRVQFWMEVRCYADGRTTVTPLKFPRSRGRIGDI